MQRVEYSLSGIYFFIGIIWTVLMLVPAIYIFFQISAYKTDPYLFTIVYLPYLTFTFLFYALTMRYRHYRIADLLRAQSLTFITLPIYMRAFFDAIFNRRSVFTKTPKTGSLYVIPWHRMNFQVALVVLNVVAILYGLWSIPDAGNKPALIVNIVWTTFHTAILLYFSIMLYEAQQSNRAQSAGRVI
jgi:hypothetical protein